MMFTSSTIFALIATIAAPSVVVSQFSYDPSSPLGPEHWASLNITDNQCGGMKNSPIAVQNNGCTRFEDYTFTPGNCTVDDLKFDILNNEVKTSYNSSFCAVNTVQIPGIEGIYEAMQFHIHTSSEHTIDGQYYGAEMHIVHKSTTEERYAVVGMMLDASSPTDNELFGQLLSKWADQAEATLAACQEVVSTSSVVDAGGRVRSRHLQSSSTFNAYALLSPDTGFFHYDGGLTTPPCSEVVWWNLASIPVSLSVAQFNALISIILNYMVSPDCTPATIASPSGSTSRPTQPLNGRTVDLICPSSQKLDAQQQQGSAAFSSTSTLTAGVAAITAATMAAFM